MQEARIDAEDIACRRGDRVLFRGLSFSLRAGEALHVTGTNGVGKSSLLRLVAGLGRPYAGFVTHEGSVGMIDERAALDLEAPLSRALSFWQRLDGNALAGLDTLGITDLLDIPVRYLSTGQRKRAAMARLLVQNARIWLLDEPLNGLDTQATRLVEDLAASHCRAGGIAVIASHQPFSVSGMRMLQLEKYAP